MSPDLGLEDAFDGVACGVDEVGRGCLAGRVTAAAVIIPGSAVAALAKVRDSKALGPAAREGLARVILDLCPVGIGHADVGEIERLNILQATFLAMRRAVAALPVVPGLALIDGNKVPPGLSVPGRSVIGGDAKSLSIAAASIVAKVDRDRHMAALDAETPGYGWAVNAGYGTPAHLEALARLGVSAHHRRTFAPVREILRPAGQAAFAF